MRKLVKKLSIKSYKKIKIVVSAIIFLSVFTACNTVSKSSLDLQGFYKEGKEKRKRSKKHKTCSKSPLCNRITS